MGASNRRFTAGRITMFSKSPAARSASPSHPDPRCTAPADPPSPAFRISFTREAPRADFRFTAFCARSPLISRSSRTPNRVPPGDPLRPPRLPSQAALETLFISAPRLALPVPSLSLSASSVKSLLRRAFIPNELTLRTSPARSQLLALTLSLSLSLCPLFD